MFYDNFEHVGSGHVESQKRGFSWLEIEAIFNNRVLTGVVLNSSYNTLNFDCFSMTREISFSIGYTIIFRDIFV